MLGARRSRGAAAPPSGGSKLVVRLAGLALAATGLFLAYREAAPRLLGERAAGIVVRVEDAYLRNTRASGYVQYPVVQFETAAGVKREYRATVGDEVGRWHQGDVVAVIYRPGDPAATVLDRGLRAWLWSGLSLLAGVVVLAANRKQ